MWILPLVGYIGILLGFGFLTLAIASGLYYLSELVEEHTVFAKKFLTRMIYSIIVIQILLIIVDRFPLVLSLLSIGSHAVYGGNLRRFPIVKLTDPLFLLSCLLVVLNHYLWFRHFSTPPAAQSNSFARHPNLGRYDQPDLPSFTEIASYFGICVWLVPFALFVSLSAGENVLPSYGDTVGELNRSTGVGDRLGHNGGGSRKKGAKGLVRVAVDSAREWVGETGEAMGFWKGDKARRF